jgi:NAD+ kinase
VPAARHAVSATSLRDALAALAAGEATTASHALLSVSVDGDHVGRAALDAGLVTSEPARISEYSIRGASGLTESFRADGVVVATPLGSAGYGRAAGGPVLAPGTGLAVTPVAPFATAADSWVLGDRVTLRVERDEGDVSLLVDDRAVQVVPSGTPVRITTDGTVDVVCASGYETGR